MKTAMLFAAGLGKRLRPLTLTTPKPLLKIGHECCFERAIALLQSVGIENIIVNVHHLPQAFDVYFERYGDLLTPSVEHDLLETGGGLKQALATKYKINSRDSGGILCMNADAWFSEMTFLDAFIDSYYPRQSDAHLFLVKKDQILFGDFPGDYALDTNGRLTHRDRLSVLPDYVFSGVQIINRAAFQTYAKDLDVFSLRGLYDHLESKKCLTGFTTQNVQYCDIGTLDTFKKLSNAVLQV